MENFNNNSNIGLIVNGDHDYKIYQNFLGNYIRLKQHFDYNIHMHDIKKPFELKESNITHLGGTKQEVRAIRLSIIRNLQNFAFVTSKFCQNEVVEEIIVNSLKVLYSLLMF